jgi:hypothetical protein
MGKPQKSKFGWRVSRTTTRSGTKKIRSTVRLFGRFIALTGLSQLADAEQAASRGCQFTINFDIE